MKNISYLEAKAWYRLVKVIFVLFIISITALMIAIVFSENRGIPDMANSKITCQFGEKKQFLVKEVFNNDEILKLSSDFNDYKDIDSLFSEKIINLCKTPLDITKRSFTPEEMNAAYPEVSYKNIRDFYTIDLLYKNKTINSLLYSLLVLLSVAGVCEIIRRVFYYVILGTMTPKK